MTENEPNASNGPGNLIYTMRAWLLEISTHFTAKGSSSVLVRLGSFMGCLLVLYFVIDKLFVMLKLTGMVAWGDGTG